MWRYSLAGCTLHVLQPSQLQMESHSMLSLHTTVHSAGVHMYIILQVATTREAPFLLSLWTARQLRPSASASHWTTS